MHEISDCLLNSVVDAATELGKKWAVVIGPTDQFGIAEVLLFQIEHEFCMQEIKTRREKMYADEIWSYVSKILTYEFKELGALLGRKKLPIYALDSRDTISPADFRNFLTIAIGGEPDAVGG